MPALSNVSRRDILRGGGAIVVHFAHYTPAGYRGARLPYHLQEMVTNTPEGYIDSNQRKEPHDSVVG